MVPVVALIWMPITRVSVDEAGGCASPSQARRFLRQTREEEFETWLRAPAEEALALAQEYPPAQMRIVQEGLEEDLQKAA